MEIKNNIKNELIDVWETSFNSNNLKICLEIIKRGV